MMFFILRAPVGTKSAAVWPTSARLSVYSVYTVDFLTGLLFSFQNKQNQILSSTDFLTYSVSFINRRAAGAVGIIRIQRIIFPLNP